MATSESTKRSHGTGTLNLTLWVAWLAWLFVHRP
jgi:hypothetical protein